MTLNDSIQIMTSEIISILNDNKPTIYLFGSVTLDDFKLGWSDIDIVVLNDHEITEQQAKILVELRQALLERYPGNPYFRLFEGGMLSLDAFLKKKNERVVYWGTSGQRIADSYFLDSFSIIELLNNGILLYGTDIREKLKRPSYSELLDDVKKHYSVIRKYGQKTSRSHKSGGWLLDIARCIYTLRTGKIIAKTAAGEWALTENICPVPEALQLMVNVRKVPLEYADNQAFLDKSEQFGEDIQVFADVLEKELNRTAYYHGTTTQGITELRANPIVYLTPNRAYALFYIIDKNINWVTCGVKDDGAVHYDERFPNQLEKLYGGKSGYLYKSIDDKLTPGNSRDIYVSLSPVAVADYEYIPDVYKEILGYEKTGTVIIKRYENLSDAEEKDVFDMMVHSILKNDLLSAEGTKAAFIRESFPDAWAYAESHAADKQCILEEWQKKTEAEK